MSISDNTILTPSQNQLLKYEELKSSHLVHILTDVSLYHWNVIVIGVLMAALIIMTMTLAGFIEVYKPLMRLKALTCP